MDLIAIPRGMETRYFVMAHGALAQAGELLRTAFPGKKTWLIADDNTWKAAGKSLFLQLQQQKNSLIQPQIFPGTPKLHPDYAVSQMLAGKMNKDIVPVAVGSGVLNDLVKCAAGIAGIPYCCVATAASVDGYTSYGGAMSVEGMKKTVPCPAPFALLADLDVLAAAPPEMLASGYADLLTKVPAGADWHIADSIGEEPIRADIWNLVQKDLRTWIGDVRNLHGIFMGLAATGYAMQLYRDSRPASGAEHMCSHIWEMEKLAVNGEEVSHGFKVGIGTVAIVQLMEFIIRTPRAEAERLARPGFTLEERKMQIRQLLAKGCYGSGIPEIALGKFRTGKAAGERRALIFERWEMIRQKIGRQLLPLAEFRRLLKAAGAPVEYAQIGLSREQYLHGLRCAQLIRKRYTVLDLLFEAGLFDLALEQLD